MDFREWEPYYLRILSDFGYDPHRDVESAELLQRTIVQNTICDEKCLRKRIGEKVTVFGAAPDLEAQIEKGGWSGPIIAAGSATSVLMAHGIVPDVMFTDLDGDVVAEVEANTQGAVAVILAHGDNMALVKRWVPMFEGSLMPTCQCRPFGLLRNFGGFTDGDRAVMTARHFGARRIDLIGFDFLHPRHKEKSDADLKLKKLGWAQHIIYDLNPSDVELVPPLPSSSGRS